MNDTTNVEPSVATINPIHRPLVAYRVVQIGILVTLIWKLSFFVTAIRVYHDLPVVDDFCPEPMKSLWLVSLSFLAAVFATGLSAMSGSRLLMKIAAPVSLAGCSILCLHQTSYNDMTFVTAWWASLWSCWYVHHIDDADRAGSLRRAAFLARLIISMILLGGAVGKWTAEYWSGEVLYDIYFRDRDFWVFNWLRGNFEPETLRNLATWYSRKVILVETAIGVGYWLIPPRLAASIGILVLSSIALFSNFLLFSVLSAVIGLAAVGYFVPPRESK